MAKVTVGLARGNTIAESVSKALDLGNLCFAKNSRVCIVPHNQAHKDIIDHIIAKAKECGVHNVSVGSRGIDHADYVIALHPAHVAVPVEQEPDFVVIDAVAYNGLVVASVNTQAAENARRAILSLQFGEEPLQGVKEIKGMHFETYNVHEAAYLFHCLRAGKMKIKKQTVTAKKELVHAQRDPAEWTQDPRGYFLFKVEEGKIRAAFCSYNHKLNKEIVGLEPQDMYYTILREGLVSSPQHAAYIGMELQKAWVALKTGIPYVQDSPLEF